MKNVSFDFRGVLFGDRSLHSRLYKYINRCVYVDVIILAILCLLFRMLSR